MEKPNGVSQAVIGIWVMIILSSVAALINKWAGDISMAEFSFTLILYGFYCMFPYKINNGSNAARYVYVVFFVINVFLMLAGIGNIMSKLDFILFILLIPLEGFIIFRLFEPDASAWFSRVT